MKSKAAQKCTLFARRLLVWPQTSQRHCRPHPLYSARKTVLYHNGAAVLVAGDALPAARHRHRALRLVARVLSVVGVAYRTSWLQLEERVDALRAKRVAAA